MMSLIYCGPSMEMITTEDLTGYRSDLLDLLKYPSSEGRLKASLLKSQQRRKR